MKYLKNFNTLQEYKDALILDVPNVSYIVEDAIVKYLEEPKVGSKYIMYTSSDEQEVTPYKTDVFGAALISNTYDDFGLISFDDSVTSIGGSAFSSCSSLTSITIPESVTSIGGWAFADCSSLTSVTIPNSVTSIGKGLFSGCTSLTSATFGSGVTTTGDYTFQHCSSLISVTIPTSVTSIGWSAFSGCTSLTSITIPNSVTNIGNSAFYGCSSLTSITIPNSVTSIGYYAFQECSSLTSLICEATTPPTLDSVNKLLPNGTVIYVPAESVEAYKTATNWSYYADKIQPIQS